MIARNTFMMNEELGRARVHKQHGDAAAVLEEAIGPMMFLVPCWVLCLGHIRARAGVGADGPDGVLLRTGWAHDQLSTDKESTTR